MAVCALPADQKEELRTWAETEKPKQEDLRQRIRDQVDAMKGIYRPDFDLKVSLCQYCHEVIRLLSDFGQMSNFAQILSIE
jgi:hypothetical protein